MGLGFIYILSQYVCLIIEGLYIGSAEVDTINNMTGFNILESQGVLGIPILSWQFFANLPTMIAWDYSFLTGGYAIFRLIMMSVSIGIVWGLIQTFGPAAQGILTSVFRFLR